MFAHRYHAHVLRSPREAVRAVEYVLENYALHAHREGWSMPRVDPWCSAAWHGKGASMVAEALWWMLRVGVERASTLRRAA